MHTIAISWSPLSKFMLLKSKNTLEELHLQAAKVRNLKIVTLLFMALIAK